MNSLTYKITKKNHYIYHRLFVTSDFSLGRHKLQLTNSLAYFVSASVTKKIKTLVFDGKRSYQGQVEKKAVDKNVLKVC